MTQMTEFEFLDRDDKKVITISTHQLEMMGRLPKRVAWAIIIVSILTTTSLGVRGFLGETNAGFWLHWLFISFSLLGALYFAYLGAEYKDFSRREKELTQFAFLAYCVSFILFWVGIYYPGISEEPSLVPQRTEKTEELGIVPLIPKRFVKKETGSVSEPLSFQFGEVPEASKNYIIRFLPLAKAEEAKFGVPACIKLAQGLLESASGTSTLARKANNHFGIKTFSKKVPHMVMKDDTPTDKFKVYDSAWESYRDHSLFLMRDHYKSLQSLSKTDYVGWAKGLQKAGYATDKNYADKIISIIKKYGLHRL